MFTQSSFACFDIVHFVAVYFIAWLAEKLPAWYPGYDNTPDKSLLVETIMLASDAGVLRIPRSNLQK